MGESSIKTPPHNTIQLKIKLLHYIDNTHVQPTLGPFFFLMEVKRK